MGLHNAIVGFPRYTPKAAIAASSAAAWYPAANLLSLPLAYPWRSASTDPAACVLTATFAPKRPIDLAVLCRHNIGLGGMVIASRYHDLALTELVDTVTVPAWPAVYGDSLVDWDGGRMWDRTYTEEEIAGYPWHLPIRFAERVYVAGVKVEIIDPANPAGFLQAGLLELAEAHQLACNFNYGAGYGFKPRTESQEADGGTLYYRRRSKGRVFEATLPFVPTDEALGLWFEMHRQLDLDTPFFWWPEPTDPLHQLRSAILATIAELSLQQYAIAGHRGVPIRLKEVL